MVQVRVWVGAQLSGFNEVLSEETSVLFSFLMMRGSKWLVLLFKAERSEPGRALLSGSEPVDCCERSPPESDGRLSPTGSAISEATA